MDNVARETVYLTEQHAVIPEDWACMHCFHIRKHNWKTALKNLTVAKSYREDGFFAIQIPTQPGIFLEFYRVKCINRAAAVWERGEKKHEQHGSGNFKRSLLTVSWNLPRLYVTWCFNLSTQSSGIKINVSTLRDTA